jgi:murein DD-endopeptidase MepM/ murein hydrolase activator NlpD
MSRFRSRSRRRHRRRLRTWCVVVAAALAWPAPALPATTAAVPARGQRVPDDGAPGLWFEPPVSAEVIDGWRPPDTPYGSGNRGWEYATTPGDPVAAAGDGTVRFAGPVGGSDAVTVAHVGGLETTYSYLDGVHVTDGQTVGLGQMVGTAGERFHFGVRLDGAYVDPAVLFRAGALRLGARLLPAE